MRTTRLTQWFGGAVAGCPGVVDASPPEEPPTSTRTRRLTDLRGTTAGTERRPRRSTWVIAAAVILVVEGGLGLASAPSLIGDGSGPITATFIVLMSFAATFLVAGLGLFRMSGWARLVAGVLSVFSLAFTYAPELISSVANGVRPSLSWLGGLAGCLVILFAVVRRWPRELRD
jgi:hypothetical protein